MNTLHLTKHSFTLRFNAETILPPFIGNTIRGALGSALSDYNSHAYAQVFKLNGSNSVPNPYAISVAYPSKQGYVTDDTLTFFITLFGNACDYISDISAAVYRMCRGRLEHCIPIGSELVYDKIWSDSDAQSIPKVENINIKFISPTEILSSGKPVLEMGFDIFIDSLLGRICDVIDNFTDEQFILPYSLIIRKPIVTAEYKLKPITLMTGRQKVNADSSELEANENKKSDKRGQPINGFMGSIQYTGNLTRYLPYIELGSQIHLGKKTTRSCGEYSFVLG